MAARIWAEFDQIPCIFPDNREIERGDWLGNRLRTPPANKINDLEDGLATLALVISDSRAAASGACWVARHRAIVALRGGLSPCEPSPRAR